MQQAIQQIQKQFPSIKLGLINIPEGDSLNTFWINYGQQGIYKLLGEALPVEGQLHQQQKTNASEVGFKPSGDVLQNEKWDAVKTSLVIYNNQKIGFIGQAGSYNVLGTLPSELGSLAITLQLEELETGKKHTRKLDLFEHEEVQSYCMELSEKQGINANVLEADIMQLSNLLSEYRDAQIEKSASTLIGNRVKQILTPEKEKEAFQFLLEPKLIKRIDKLIAQSGVIGEENNRVLLFVCASTFKSNPLHVLVQGTSGSGKSHLINATKDNLPAEEVINLTRVTSKSFYHYQGDDLVNKLIVIQDFDGLDEEAQLAFRELQSASYLSSSTVFKDKYGNLQSHVKHVKALISSMMATTKAEIYFDNMSRSVVIGVDESEEQTRRIIDYQNKRIAGLINMDVEQQARELLQNSIRVLKPYKVINRYANKINLPVEAKMLRRLNEQFQLFVLQVTYLHQYQREIDEQGRVVATKEDIKQATELFFDAIMLKVDELDSSTRQFFEQMKAYVKKQGNKNFTQREIRQALNQSKTQCFRYFDTLQRLEYIAVAEGTANKGFIYKVIFWDELEKLRTRIKTGLLSQIEQL